MMTHTDRPKRARKRTDPHRPGAIIPAHYEYALSFNLATTQDGWPVPSYGINCELDRRHEVDGQIVNGKHDADGRCCTIGLRLIGKHKYALGGGPGKCTVCGACYIYGDAWIHKPTGDVVFLGHDCAQKYSLLADRSEHELALGRLRQAAATACLRAAKADQRAAFLLEHPGLEAALQGDHRILRDLASKFVEFTSLSEKQIALALKLKAELDNPKPVEVEVNVPAPVGKQTFRGTVVSTRAYDGDWGVSYRMTVKVTTPAGVWLAWGTAPTYILDQIREHGMSTEHGVLHGLRGCEVEITAMLQKGRDAHFALMKRPRGELVSKRCSHDDNCDGCLRDRTGRLYPFARELRDCRTAEVRSRADGRFDDAVRYQQLGDDAERVLAMNSNQKGPKRK